MKTIIKIIITSVIAFNMCVPNIAHNSMQLQDDFTYAKSKFKWLEKDFYTYLEYKCKKKGIDPLFMLSLIQVESGGKNVVSKKNGNKTRDFGFCQINSVHSPKNPRRLLNYKVNLNIGTWYIGKALKKAKGNLRLACIYYNGGLNCNVRKYKNKWYPKRIVRIYNKVHENINCMTNNTFARM